MVEYIGYLASVIVLISLLMSSVKKLRWINLFGSLTFVIYGFLIKAYPIAILNIGTVSINIYFLIKMANTRSYFKILEIDKKSDYFDYFLELHKEDLSRFIDIDKIDIETADLRFYILRDIIPAGVFSGKRYDDHTLLIELDYVSPPYRDFSFGKYLYTQEKELFLNKGYNRLITLTDNKIHKDYLLKMGFHRNESLDQENQLAYEINL